MTSDDLLAWYPKPMNFTSPALRYRVGLVGFGMIVEETYLPIFASQRHSKLGNVVVTLEAVASRTGARFAKYVASLDAIAHPPAGFHGDRALDRLLETDLHAVAVATPDDRHFEAALAVIRSGRHVLIEKPSVLSLDQLDQLCTAADEHQVLAKVVYHKLFDPDHKRLRTLVSDGVLSHVNSGYCTLLEPRSISADQFSEWITGRNPATYVAVHYHKLIDFTFGPRWKLTRIMAEGQRGVVGPVDGNTWDAVMVRIVYTHPDHREATFDIHTNWVNPNNFPGYVEQEVQFRFDNGLWLGHQRKRGVEVTVEGRTPEEFKTTPNHHYNAEVIEPWGERTCRGYGLEAVRRFFEEAAHVDFGGPPEDRPHRLATMRSCAYNDLAADRNVVAIVQAVEAILTERTRGQCGTCVEVNSALGGLVLRRLDGSIDVMYPGTV